MCDNRIDDDGDGLVDWPADDGCASASGAHESQACLPERTVTPVGAGLVAGRVLLGAEPITISTSGNQLAGQQVSQAAVGGPSNLQIEATSATRGVRLNLSVRRSCESTDQEVGCENGLRVGQTALNVPADRAGDYFVRVAPTAISSITSGGQPINFNPGNDQGFVPLNDIQSHCGWNDGGSDAFDCFGTFTLTHNDTASVPDIALGQRQAAAGSFGYRVSSDLADNNIWRVRFDPLVAGDDQPVRVQVTGRLGATGDRRATPFGTSFYDETVSALITSDRTNTAPDAIFVMVPGVPEDWRGVRYTLNEGVVAPDSGLTQLPVTFYVALTNTHVANVMLALERDMIVQPSPVSPGDPVDFNLRVVATPVP